MDVERSVSSDQIAFCRVIDSVAIGPDTGVRCPVLDPNSTLRVTNCCGSRCIRPDEVSNDDRSISTDSVNTNAKISIARNEVGRACVDTAYRVVGPASNRNTVKTLTKCSSTG